MENSEINTRFKAKLWWCIEVHECLFNKWCLENQIAIFYKSVKVESYLILHTKVHSKCIGDFENSAELIQHGYAKYTSHQVWGLIYWGLLPAAYYLQLSTCSCQPWNGQVSRRNITKQTNGDTEKLHKANGVE